MNPLRRLLRSGAIFIATTHAPALTYNRPDMAVADHERLRDPNLEREWTRDFELLAFRAAGLADSLDLSVWRR